jgi:hypothetical protein
MYFAQWTGGLHWLLRHADTVIVEGKSYRMKDQIEAP